MTILYFFVYFCGSFFFSWIRIKILNLNANPDPANQINADPDTDLDPQPWAKHIIYNFSRGFLMGPKI